MNLDEYFSHKELDENIVIISVYDEGSKYWKNFKMREQLNLKADLSFRASYIAVIDVANNFTYENTGYEQLKYDFKLDDGNIIHITSCGYQISPNKSEIIFNGKDYSQSKRGLNIAIYNKKDRRIVDTVSVDSFADSKLNVVSKFQQYYDRADKINRGFLIADEYCSYDNSIFYMIINRHIGDADRVLARLHSVKEYYGEKADRFHFSDGKSNMLPRRKVKLIKKLVVVTTRSISGVAKLYSYAFDELLVLPKEQLDDLEMYSCAPSAIHQNIVCDEESYFKVCGRRTDEGHWTRSVLVGVEDFQWYLCLPQSLMKKTAMAIDDKTKNNTQEVIEKNSIETDKTVIICPYAKSSSMLPNKCWELFAEELKKNGYRVFTNAFGDEVAIEGTDKLSVDIDVMACLAHSGCKIIGVQCGLMDVLVRSKGPNITVLSIIITDGDMRYAKGRGALNEVNNINGTIYLRIEHFEEDYVVKLLMDNFNGR